MAVGGRRAPGQVLGFCCWRSARPRWRSSRRWSRRAASGATATAVSRRGAVGRRLGSTTAAGRAARRSSATATATRRPSSATVATPPPSASPPTSAARSPSAMPSALPAPHARSAARRRRRRLPERRRGAPRQPAGRRDRVHARRRRWPSAARRERLRRRHADAAALLVAGTNVLAVEVHQANATSSDISFDLELVASTDTATVTRGPYLQLGTATGVVVRWRTTRRPTAACTYGTAARRADRRSPATAALTTEHVVALTGLRADTEYYYAVGTQRRDAGRRRRALTTSAPAPAPGTPAATRIWVVGDSGTGGAGRARGARRLPRLRRRRGARPVADARRQRLHQRHRRRVPDAACSTCTSRCSRTSVLWPTLGNHDGLSADSATQSGPYYDIFTLPAAGRGGRRRLRHRGLLLLRLRQHPLRLPRLVRDQPLAERRHADLARRRPRRQPRRLGDRLLASPAVQQGLARLRRRDRAGADAAERAARPRGRRRRPRALAATATPTSAVVPARRPLRRLVHPAGVDDPRRRRRRASRATARTPSRWPVSAPHGGTVYVVAGSGAQTGGGALNHPAMVRSLGVLGSLVLDVVGNTLSVRFLTDTGAVRDAFTITKGAVPTSVASGTITYYRNGGAVPGVAAHRQPEQRRRRRVRGGGAARRAAGAAPAPQRRHGRGGERARRRLGAAIVAGLRSFDAMQKRRLRRHRQRHPEHARRDQHPAAGGRHHHRSAGRRPLRLRLRSSSRPPRRRSPADAVAAGAQRRLPAGRHRARAGARRGRGLDFSAAVFGDCTGNWSPSPALRRTGEAPRVRVGRVRRTGGQWRLALTVSAAQPLSAVELALAAPGQQLRGVRSLGGARDALVRVDVGRRIASRSPVAVRWTAYESSSRRGRARRGRAPAYHRGARRRAARDRTLTAARGINWDTCRGRC